MFQIASEAGEAQRQAEESLKLVLELDDRQRSLTREFSRNERDVRRAVNEVSGRRPARGVAGLCSVSGAVGQLAELRPAWAGDHIRRFKFYIDM